MQSFNVLDATAEVEKKAYDAINGFFPGVGMWNFENKLGLGTNYHINRGLSNCCVYIAVIESKEGRVEKMSGHVKRMHMRKTGGMPVRKLR